VPLDRDPTYGWTTREGSTSTDAGGAGGEHGQAGAGNQSNSGARQLRVALPEAVCDRISAKKVLAVRVSTSCQTKTPQYPTCGPWSSVGEALVSQADTSASAASGSTVSGGGGAGMNPTTTGAIASGGQTDSEMESNSTSTTNGTAGATPEAAGGATGFGGTTGSTTGSGGAGRAGSGGSIGASTTGVMGGGGVTGSGAAAGSGGTTGSSAGGTDACMDSVSYGGAPPDGPQGCSATNCEGNAVSCAGADCTCNGEALAESLEPTSCEPPATECCPDMALAWSACGFGSHDVLSP
jgi:hypothetical protein